MVMRPIETPPVLQQDLWVRVNQTAAIQHVAPVTDQKQREESNEERRDRFERQFPPRGQHAEEEAEEAPPVIAPMTIRPRLTMPSYMGQPVIWVGTQLTLPGMEAAYERPPLGAPDAESGSTLDLEA